MAIKLMKYGWTSLLAVSCAASLSAAPQLQLAATTVRQVTIVAGTNGATQSVDAQNTGDGSLNLQVTSSAPWIVPSVGSPHSCSSGNGASCLPIQIALQTSSLGLGGYAGLVEVYDPSAINAPQYINVSVEVGTGVPSTLTFWVQNGEAATLQFGTASLATTTVGAGATTWLSAAQAGGSPFTQTIPYAVTATAGSMATGNYSGSLQVGGSAAAADNKTISVTLNVVADPVTTPLASIGGAVNNTIYLTGESLPEGGIIALFGKQFITGSAAGATSLPLGTTLGNVQLLLNGQPVPLYYVSTNQINFQIPYDAQVGAGTLQVVSGGTNGNIISVTIAKSVPRILQIDDPNDYGIIVNASDNSFAIPTTSGIASSPATIGKAITIYAIGLGPTNPAVDTGAGSPSSPLASATDSPQVCFIPPTPFDPKGLCVAPLFAGLSPNYVGLFQVNVVVPQGAPVGNVEPIVLLTSNGQSNTVNIAIQQ